MLSLIYISFVKRCLSSLYLGATLEFWSLNSNNLIKFHQKNLNAVNGFSELEKQNLGITFSVIVFRKSQCLYSSILKKSKLIIKLSRFLLHSSFGNCFYCLLLSCTFICRGDRMKNDGQTQRGHRRDSRLKAISCQNLSVSYSQLKGKSTINHTH